MANPSTTGPSGIGSEVLRRTHSIATGAGTATLLTVGTDMIVTVLCITCTNQDSSARTYFLTVHPDGGNQCVIARHDLQATSTFIFNDKLVLTETDVLKLESTSTDHDIYVSYIEQEFA